MGKLSDVAAVFGILISANTLYDAHIRRKRDEANDEKDRKIKELEARVAELEKTRKKK